MSEQDQGLQKVEPQVPIIPSKKVGFHNQANIKAAARGIVLEALTAFKGGKVGKRGLLVKAMAHLEQAFESGNPETRSWATEQVLKLANGMTKDDKSNPLDDLLKGSANIQINFNTHFSQRQSEACLNRSGHDLPGQALTIGFGKAEALTPPPGPGA